jgi:hypothetical protein
MGFISQMSPDIAIGASLIVDTVPTTVKEEKPSSGEEDAVAVILITAVVVVAEVVAAAVVAVAEADAKRAKCKIGRDRQNCRCCVQ